jgi:hypothetical protein
MHFICAADLHGRLLLAPHMSCAANPKEAIDPAVRIAVDAGRRPNIFDIGCRAVPRIARSTVCAVGFSTLTLRRILDLLHPPG